ncbi:MAG: serine hydrolase domain-containing protein [Pseudomonadota bacterium]
MKVRLLALCMFTVTASGAAAEVADGGSQGVQAIAWIERNLAPAHSLEQHVQRRALPDVMEEYRIPGLSMAFVDRGKIAWTQAYGFASLENREAVTGRTVFTGASLSKPLAAVAALDLVESGLLDLDSDVNRWLQGWQIPANEFTAESAVTLRLLLGHRAGVRNDLWSSYLPDEPVPTLLQMLSGQPPSVEPATAVVTVPGDAERYSNPGYTIIQKLIEDVTGQAFAATLDEKVFRPSRMHESTFEQPIPSDLFARKATGYDGDLEPFAYKIFPYQAAGGVWTTPSDMARFVITLFEDLDGANQILAEQTAQQIFERDPARLAFAKIFDDTSDDLIFRHYGTNQGFSSYLVGSLQKRQAVVIMTNGHMAFEFLDYVARAVAEFYEWDYLQPEIHPRVAIAAAELAGYAGEFDLNGTELAFSVEDGGLVMKHEAKPEPTTLTPIGPGTFMAPEASVRYQFLKARQNSDGTFVWVRVTAAGGSEDYAGRVESTAPAAD